MSVGTSRNCRHSVASASRLQRGDPSRSKVRRSVHPPRQCVQGEEGVRPGDSRSQRAIRLDPKYAPAFHNRGNAYRAKNEYDRAIADYNDTIRLDPKFALALYWRGEAKEMQGDASGGAADISKQSS
jgi:hypothetical protein